MAVADYSKHQSTERRLIHILYLLSVWLSNTKGRFFMYKREKNIKTQKRTRKLNKAEMNRLRDYYRKEVMNEETLEHLKQEDFNNLTDIAKHADFGASTAVQSSFCLGYKAGKGGEG